MFLFLDGKVVCFVIVLEGDFVMFEGICWVELIKWEVREVIKGILL